MKTRRHLIWLFCLALLFVGAFSTPASAQLSRPLFTRPGLAWQTARTEHFTIYYPQVMQDWALDMARHLEAERGAIVALVGSTPAHRVAVIVEDPYTEANGFALPIINAPAIFVWPTPPTPTEDIGDFRTWGTLVSVHEFAHIAHLTRPSRNPWQRLWWRLLGADLSPLARRSPRWLFEGYAVYVEGRITGGGRPYSAARASALRTLALEGKLPTYSALDGAPTYEGGEMAYLVGSAFLEWLVARDGEASLGHLWRRMTARSDRGFVPAFSGVFGGPPDELYGQFTAELTAKAVAAANVMRARGLDTGVTVQRLDWYTGAPAVSRDGQFLAITLHTPEAAPRIVIWNMTSHTEDSTTARTRAQLLAQDSEDVAAVPYAPPAKTPVATLLSHNGLAYGSPRFLADGEHVLVVRDAPMGDGSYRPDLFLWDRTNGHVHRITRGAGIEAADPMLDGSAAVGVRCLNGICDLVRVDLATGALHVIAAGSPTRQFYRPRVADNGRVVIVSVHDSTNHARWHLVQISLDSTEATETAIGPQDSANRYQAAFLPGDSAVVTVSDAGGVTHLETIDLASGATRVVGIAYGALTAPEPSRRDTSVYCLSLYSKGETLNRIALTDTTALLADTLPSSLAPVVPVIGPATPPLDTMQSADSVDAQPYNIGPREFRVLPGGVIAADGRYGTLSLIGTDPIGRLSWTVTGVAGDPGTWRGLSVNAAWRGLPDMTGSSTVELSMFTLQQHPSRQIAGSFLTNGTSLSAFDANYHGASMAFGHAESAGWGDLAWRLGASVGSLALADNSPGERTLAFLELGADQRYGQGSFYLDRNWEFDGAVGNTGGATWQRGLAQVSIGAGISSSGLRASLAYGATNAAAPTYEQFVVGGASAPLTDSAVYRQRLVAPGLPFGIAAGRLLFDYRFSTDGPGPTWYYEAFSAGPSLRGWHRLWGVDWTWAIPTITFVRLPAIHADMGATYSISAPFDNRLRGYVGIHYSP